MGWKGDVSEGKESGWRENDLGTREAVKAGKTPEGCCLGQNGPQNTLLGPKAVRRHRFGRPEPKEAEGGVGE
jgi:hypothetical protein